MAHRSHRLADPERSLLLVVDLQDLLFPLREAFDSGFPWLLQCVRIRKITQQRLGLRP